jgi:hypothetical protein
MKGLIIIPDITGFTNFVKHTNIDLGATITTALLNEIIDSNPLDLNISEIEGDAVLFYKMGKPIPITLLFAGLKNIYQAFNAKLRSLRLIYNLHADLSLKFIIHYGDINVYNIKGFKKLFGETVIEAHRLLKNEHSQSNYILITEDYLSAVGAVVLPFHVCNWKYNSFKSQFLEGLREVSFHYYNYSLIRPNKRYVYKEACLC